MGAEKPSSCQDVLKGGYTCRGTSDTRITCIHSTSTRRSRGRLLESLRGGIPGVCCERRCGAAWGGLPHPAGRGAPGKPARGARNSERWRGCVAAGSSCHGGSWWNLRPGGWGMEGRSDACADHPWLLAPLLHGGQGSYPDLQGWARIGGIRHSGVGVRAHGNKVCLSAAWEGADLGVG